MISPHEIGLRFCGIVELAPRPGHKRLAASPNSVADISITSIGDLAEAAAEQRQELHGLGDAVAGDVPGDRRLGEAELARPARRTVRSAASPLPSEARVPAAPPNCADSTRGRSSARRSAWRSNA